MYSFQLNKTYEDSKSCKKVTSLNMTQAAQVLTLQLQATYRLDVHKLRWLPIVLQSQVPEDESSSNLPTLEGKR